VRDVVALDYTIGLLVSVAMLAYLVLAMLKPEKF
jgi:K+-transporting ATPase KdpF subunit